MWKNRRNIEEKHSLSQHVLGNYDFRKSVCCFVAEDLVKHLTSYEIVKPTRLNEFGEAFPHTHHFKRRKRSMDAEALPFRTHYRLSAYGQIFHLNLSADTSFIAPHYIEVHVGATKSHLPSDLHHCFYRGHVNAHEKHTAVFSLCGGLVSRNFSVCYFSLFRSLSPEKKTSTY